MADRHKARFGCEGKRKCDFWVILTLLKDLKEKKDLLHMHFEDWTQVNYPLNPSLNPGFGIGKTFHKRTSKWGLMTTLKGKER